MVVVLVYIVQARLQEITSPYFTRSKIKVYSFEMRLIMIVKITETHSDYSTALIPRNSPKASYSSGREQSAFFPGQSQ